MAPALIRITIAITLMTVALVVMGVAMEVMGVAMEVMAVAMEVLAVALEVMPVAISKATLKEILSFLWLMYSMSIFLKQGLLLLQKRLINQETRL